LTAASQDEFVAGRGLLPLNRFKGRPSLQWRAEAEFLTETYHGSDAYVTHDGLMYAQVTTFNGADLKMKP
jgi:hypothetical protein